MSGAELIAQERQRQIDVEGWTAKHDDHHKDGELSRAAESYLWAAIEGMEMEQTSFKEPPMSWPWEHAFWKPKGKLSNLIKAGALIAAEIDRLKRANP